MEKRNRKEMLEKYKEREITGGVYIIKNTLSGKMLLQSAADLQGAKNRYEFSKATGSCVHAKLQKEWGGPGSGLFVFEVLEKLEKKETQAQKEFQKDLKLLEEMWAEKLGPENLY